MPEPQDGKPAGTATATPDSSAGQDKAPEPASTPASPADNGSSGAGDGHGNKVPDTRFKEVVDQKNHYSSLYEEEKARRESLEAELAAKNTPPAITPTKPDPFSDPEGFARDVARKETEPLKKELTSLVKERVENAIGEEFSRDRVMQKVFSEKGKLFKAIAETAVKYGQKELTPQVIHAAYQQLLVDNRELFNKTAIEMGIEEERAKAKALDGSSIPTGPGSSGTVKSGKPTQADRSILKKAFGWSDDKIEKHLANAEVDERGNRKVKRGGSNG